MNGRKIHSFQRQINQNEIRSKSNEKKNHNNKYVFFLFVSMKKRENDERINSSIFYLARLTRSKNKKSNDICQKCSLKLSIST
jgi:hypothetical protein